MKNRIKEVIYSLKTQNKHITVDSIVTESLFTIGGTLLGYEEEIKEVLWEIRANIEREVKQKLMHTSQNIEGLALSIEVNAWFNEPITTQFINK